MIVIMSDFLFFTSFPSPPSFLSKGSIANKNKFEEPLSKCKNLKTLNLSL